jgi:hopanoid biosynthesis associated protein HpnK
VTVRRLVVTADDFGAAPEVNAAVVHAHRDGILTSASLMVTGDAVEEAVALARATPTLAVGLHLVLAQGRPAAPRAEIPDLVAADGAFRRAPVGTGFRYAWQYLLRTGRPQLRREIEAQLAAFAATGLHLAHLDGHLNMHLHPMVLPILLELAPRWGIRAMRLTREDLGAALRWDRSDLLRKVGEGVVFHALAAYAVRRLRAAGIATADRVYGMHQTGHIDERYLLALLASLPPGVSELYCHPAAAVASAMAPYQQGYDHAGELAALTSARVREAVRAAGVELVSYTGLGR